jgi:hypothetical protein
MMMGEGAQAGNRIGVEGSKERLRRRPYLMALPGTAALS